MVAGGRSPLGRAFARPACAALLALAGLGALVAVAQVASASFVAVGQSGTILTSPDGIGWTPQTSGVSNLQRDAVFGGGQWLVAGVNDMSLLSSPTGVTWTNHLPAPTGNSATNMFFGFDWDGARWVGAGSNNAFTSMSTDGLAWTQESQVVPPSAFFSDVHGDGALWVAVGYGGTSGGGLVRTSADAVNWVPQPNLAQQLFAVDEHGGQWVAVGAGGLIATSPDGTTWTTQASGTARGLDGVTWGAGRWTVVGDLGTILTSPDGVAWTTQPGGTTAFLADIAFDGCQWVAVGAGGTILTSTTSTTWTSQIGGGAGLQGVGARMQACASPTCQPGSQDVLVGQDVTWDASGAIPPYTWTAPGSTNPGPANGASFTTSYTTAGTYTATLASSAALPPAPSTACTVVVHNPPAPECSPDGQNVLVGATASFLASSGIPPYEWSAPGGLPGPASGASFAAAYDLAGTYTVTVRDAGPPVQSAQCKVTVHNPPATTCAPGTATVLVGEPMSFAAGAGVPPYAWAAPGSGDPGPVAGDTFTTSYDAAGTYTVTVSDSGPPVQPAQCTVVVEPPMLLCLPASQTVTAGTKAAVMATGGSGLYAWRTASGNPTSGTGATFLPMYALQGTYTVTVASGGRSAECAVRVVAPPPPAPPQPPAQRPYPPPTFASLSPGRSPPVPVLEADPTCAGLAVRFDASRSYDRDGAVRDWLWEFGDGTTARGPTVLHEYGAAGAYAARVTVQDDGGLATTAGTDVVLGTCAPLSLSAPSLSVHAGQSVQACVQAAGGRGPKSFDAGLGAGTLPGATFDGVTGCLFWTVPANPAGTGCLAVTVRDESASASACLSVQVVQPAVPAPVATQHQSLPSRPPPAVRPQTADSARQATGPVHAGAPAESSWAPWAAFAAVLAILVAVLAAWRSRRRSPTHLRGGRPRAPHAD